MSRVTRSKQVPTCSNSTISSSSSSKVTVHFKEGSTSNENIQMIPRGSSLAGLTRKEVSLLRQKQESLSAHSSSIADCLPRGSGFPDALGATLIFAQYEAGTAVCIHEDGWILTCAHCIGDTEEEKDSNNKRWLLFHTGIAVQAECRAWDPVCDLALLKIITVESDAGTPQNITSFKFVQLSKKAPRARAPIVCIGQPGRDDLESTGNQRTKYNLIEISTGSLCGMVQDVDPCDNQEIGTQMHNAWTYWGHSGAPLLLAADATLVGLHSSWDDQTAMRHGVPLVAIQEFLRQEHVEVINPSITD